MEALQQQVEDLKENMEGSNSVLIQGLSYLPGWNEKNFQVWMISDNSMLAAAASREKSSFLLICVQANLQCAVCFTLLKHSCRVRLLCSS